MYSCRQTTITDAAFVNLKGILKLNMSHCSQLTITDAAFEHLKGIQELDMSYSNLATITDAAVEHLKGVKVLKMYSCSAFQAAIAAGLPAEGGPPIFLHP